MKRISALIATILLLSLASTISPATAAAAPLAKPKGGSSYPEMTKGYSCARSGTTQGLAIHKCAKITWEKENIEMNGPVSAQVRNRTGSKQSMTCVWEETKTWTFSASVSSEIEAGVIFARAKVQVSASASRSKSVKIGTSVNVTVRPRHVAWCLSGIAKPKFGGVVKTLHCAQTGQCFWADSKSFSASVPEQFVWELRERKLS